MKIPYEILIRGNPDGTLSGCHAIDTPGGDARPITQNDLAAIAPAINAAALATNAAELATAAAELEAVKTKLAEREALIESAKDAIKGAIADASLDDTATVATIAQVVAIAELPAIEKRRLEIEAEIAQKQAELDALTVEPSPEPEPQPEP
jgi:hypothetical protein